VLDDFQVSSDFRVSQVFFWSVEWFLDKLGPLLAVVVVTVLEL
jgi:hypothetical protein